MGAALLLALLPARGGSVPSSASPAPLLPIGPPAPAAEGPPAADVYRIDARLGDDGRTLAGVVSLRWTNRSNRILRTAVVRREWNAFARGSVLLAEDPPLEAALARRDGFGFCEIRRALFLPDGIPVPIRNLASPEAAATDRTLAELLLPREIAPGAECELRLEFEGRFPRGAPRTGARGRFLAASGWYPRLAHLGPDGWATRAVHRWTEREGERADYDVLIDLPSDRLVGATGEPSGPATSPEPGRRKSRFRASRVPDFAWFADPRFREYRERLPATGERGEVEVVLLLQPEHEGQAARHLSAIREAFTGFERELGPYPWPRFTAVDPRWRSGAGGMEFPTLVSLGTSILAPRLAANPEAIVFHEVAHQWFFALVASDEVEEAWLDEGLATWASGRLLQRGGGPNHWSLPLFGLPVPVESVPIRFPEDTSAAFFDAPRRPAGGTPSWQLADGPTYRAVSYLKPTLALTALERTVGSEEIDRAVRLYVDRFRFRRATGADFRQALADGAGPEAAQLFDELFLGDDVVDFSLSRCETTPHPDPRRGWRSFVEVTRTGEARVPVEVEMVFADGTRVRGKWEGTGRSTSWQAEGARLVEARVDPDRKLPLDPTPFDDSRRTVPNGRTGARWAERVSWWVAWAAELAASLG